MRIGVIGGGAVGLLLASYLYESQYDVTVYTNSERQANIINSKGLTLIKNNIDQRYYVKAESFNRANCQDDLLFIAVKQYHLHKVVSQLPNKIKENCSLVFLQNGMSHLALFDQLSNYSIQVGIIEHGALKHSDSVVEHTGVGSLKIGCYNFSDHQLNEIWNSLDSSGFSTIVQDNWLIIMKRKLVANAVINPLTALYGVENGKLLSSNYFREVMYGLFKEAVEVLDLQSEYDSLWNDLIQICKKTTKNRSSMLRDFDENRKTEIEAISGFLVNQAETKGSIIPYTQFVYQSIKGLEELKIGGAEDGR